MVLDPLAVEPIFPTSRQPRRFEQKLERGSDALDHVTGLVFGGVEEIAILHFSDLDRGFSSEAILRRHITAKEHSQNSESEPTCSRSQTISFTQARHT